MYGKNSNNSGCVMVKADVNSGIRFCETAGYSTCSTLHCKVDTGTWEAILSSSMRPDLVLLTHVELQRDSGYSVHSK